MSSHRFSGRVEQPFANAQHSAQIGASRANESLGHLGSERAPKRRLTSRYFDNIRSRLSARDLAIITSVGKLRLVSGSQLQRLHFVDGTEQSNPRLARRALRRLTDLHMIARLERRIGGVRAGSSGYLYMIGPGGQYMLSAPDEKRRRRVYEPGLAFVAHRLAITELAVQLTEADRAGLLELLDFSPEPDCWRSFFGPGGARFRLKPDAFVRIGIGNFEQLAFIEVDRATQSGPAVTNKFRLYRQYWATGKEQLRWGDVFPEVVWLVPGNPRLRQLLDIAANQPPESWELFRVRLFDEAIPALTRGSHRE